jgi:hypothetical protein
VHGRDSLKTMLENIFLASSLPGFQAKKPCHPSLHEVSPHPDPLTLSVGVGIVLPLDDLDP